MAIISAAAFKAAVALAAAEFTTMMQDDTLTETTPILRNNHHPLRNWIKFFNYNKSTGVVTADDAYVDAAYAGAYPNQGNDLDFVANSLLAFVSGTVEAAEPADIVLTFDKNISTASNIQVGGTANTIVSVTIVDAVVTIVVGTPYAALEPITVTGDFRSIDGGIALLSAEVITNNVV